MGSVLLWYGTATYIKETFVVTCVIENDYTSFCKHVILSAISDEWFGPHNIQHHITSILVPSFPLQKASPPLTLTLKQLAHSLSVLPQRDATKGMLLYAFNLPYCPNPWHTMLVQERQWPLLPRATRHNTGHKHMAQTEDGHKQRTQTEDTNRGHKLRAQTEDTNRGHKQSTQTEHTNRGHKQRTQTHDTMDDMMAGSMVF